MSEADSLEVGQTASLCRVNELRTEPKRFVLADRKTSVVAFIRDGRISVCGGVCPHEDVSLESASIENGKIICQVHNYEFDLENGGCVPDGNLRLPIYRVTVKEGRVLIKLKLGPS